MPGIMLWFRWYITHNEPLSVITTSTTVKISASMVQPFSDFAFMCRKYTMCTTICTAAKPRITMAVTLDFSNTLPMTSQNGMAVRITDSTKPVM